MNLETDISTWNLKSKDHITVIYQTHVGDPQLSAKLVNLLRKQDLQHGATWLLKHHFEKTGGMLEASLADIVFQHLPTLQHWETKLHILQSMQHLPIAEKHVPVVESFLKTCLTEDKKFVRAWTCSAYAELVHQHPKFQKQVRQLLQLGLETETAGSIKARILRAITICK